MGNCLSSSSSSAPSSTNKHSSYDEAPPERVRESEHFHATSGRTGTANAPQHQISNNSNRSNNSFRNSHGDEEQLSMVQSDIFLDNTSQRSNGSHLNSSRRSSHGSQRRDVSMNGNHNNNDSRGSLHLSEIGSLTTSPQGGRRGSSETNNNNNSSNNSLYIRASGSGTDINGSSSNRRPSDGSHRTNGGGGSDTNIGHLSTPLLPDDTYFEPSINGRNGWRFEQLYSVGDELGHGAFGAVFVGTHKFSQGDNGASTVSPEWRKVAIKRTTPNALDLRGGAEIRTYEELRERCQEIKTLTQLQSGSPATSNVLYLYEYFLSGRDFYMVTELLGQELDDWRAQCELFTERMAIDICRTILQSIAFCESRRVIHRDIKLQNILFRVNGNFRTLKLVDFGLSRVLENNEQVRDFCGSIGYIAPEIYTGKSYQYEVDMFAFGVLLFRLLSGERPFPSNNSQILKRHTVELRYNVQGQDWENVSAAAKDLVRKLLINREERLSAERALNHRWFSEIGQSVLRPDRSTAHTDPSRSRAVVFSEVPAASVEMEDGSRFWIDSEVEIALATIMSYNIYSGRVVERSRNSASASSVLMCVQETLSPVACTVPEYISRLERYSERECRAICKQVATCIQILHNAGIAHRNLHLDNVVIDPLGTVSLRGLHYAQPIREDQPLTGHFGYLYSWYAFKAPEVDSEFVHDKSVDLWSLGAIICFLLTGLPPFRGSGMALIDSKHAGEFDFDVAVPSPPARNLVRGLLQVSTSARFTIEDVLDHEWMIEADEYLETQDLEIAFSGLQDWEAVHPEMENSSPLCNRLNC